MSRADNASKTSIASIPYDNNPFTIAINGLRLLFQLALPIAVLATILSLVGLFSNTSQRLATSNTPIPIQSDTSASNNTLEVLRKDIVTMKQNVEQTFEDNLPTMLAAIGSTALLFVIVATLFASMLDYTAAHLSKNKKVALTDAFATAIREFFPYLWLRVLIVVKVALWSLLFIIPGIVMSVRYSLAGVSFYDKSLGANAATKDSSRLVKGAWLTTNGSFSLLNIITFGIMQPVLQVGTSAILYKQLNAYDQAGTTKPKAHILSWLTLVIPYTVLILSLIVLVIAAIALLRYLN
jgi:hypothetical protein